MKLVQKGSVIITMTSAISHYMEENNDIFLHMTSKGKTQIFKNDNKPSS